MLLAQKVEDIKKSAAYQQTVELSSEKRVSKADLVVFV